MYVVVQCSNLPLRAKIQNVLETKFDLSNNISQSRRSLLSASIESVLLTNEIELSPETKDLLMKTICTHMQFCLESVEDSASTINEIAHISKYHNHEDLKVDEMIIKVIDKSDYSDLGYIRWQPSYGGNNIVDNYITSHLDTFMEDNDYYSPQEIQKSFRNWKKTDHYIPLIPLDETDPDLDESCTRTSEYLPNIYFLVHDQHHSLQSIESELHTILGQ